MSVAYFQSRRKNALSYLNLRSVLEDRYWLCSSASIEADESTSCDKKRFDWMNENSCLV